MSKEEASFLDLPNIGQVSEGPFIDSGRFHKEDRDRVKGSDFEKAFIAAMQETEEALDFYDLMSKSPVYMVRTYSADGAQYIKAPTKEICSLKEYLFKMEKSLIKLNMELTERVKSEAFLREENLAYKAQIDELQSKKKKKGKKK